MKFAFILLLAFLYGCKQPDKRSAIQKQVSRSDSLRIEKIKAQVNLKKQHLVDSIRQDYALKKILAYAYQHVRSSYSKKGLKLWDDASLFCDLSFGNIFSKAKKHLIIQNMVNLYEFNENIYLLRNGKFVNIVKEKVSDLTFVLDSIADVNGDEYKDFLLNWYPESGCCARSVYNVYLYMPVSGTFSKKYKFINPNFFPKQKTIRGVKYGHPGEVPLYKYKWKGEKLDTIEYIYPADTTRKKFYMVKHYGDEGDPKKRKVLNSVPREYQKLDGYDWFINY